MGIVSFASDGYLINSLTFLLLKPDYVCVYDGAKFYCDSEMTCSKTYNVLSNGNSDGYFVNWESEMSLHNWVETFNLRCSESWVIGSFAIAFFIGQTFGTSALSHLGDTVGRITMLR